MPLGVQPRNEIYLTEMCEILQSFNCYVPSQIDTNKIAVNGGDYQYDNTKLFQLLLFGDQLTVARARSAMLLRDPQLLIEDKLKGFVPTCADWHARICLVEVPYNHKYYIFKLNILPADHLEQVLFQGNSE